MGFEPIPIPRYCMPCTPTPCVNFYTYDLYLVYMVVQYDIYKIMYMYMYMYIYMLHIHIHNIYIYTYHICIDHRV